MVIALIYGYCFVSLLLSFENFILFHFILTYWASLLLSNMNRNHLDEHNYCLHLPNLPEQNIEDVDEEVNGKYFLTHQFVSYFLV